MEDKNAKLKIDIKSILKVVGLLYAILLLVGILTYVLPTGRYLTTVDETGREAIVPDTFEYAESTTRIPWYRWPTAPVETLIFDSQRTTILVIIATILILGGCFKVLDCCGAMPALVRLLILRFKKRRFLAICAITLVMMLLSSFFGLQEELFVIFPVFLSLAAAMRWDRKTALSLVLITTGVGFTCALFNPFTVGICSELAKVSIMDGLWFRAVMFVILFAATCVYMVFMAKRDEKKLGIAEKTEDEPSSLTRDESRRAFAVLGLFGFVLAVVIVFGAVPALADLGLSMIVMAAAFLIGTAALGRILTGSFKALFKAFFRGVLDVAPSAIVIVTAFSIKYVAEKGDILHTVFHAMSGMLTGFSPYVAVLIILGFVLVLEFFIPSATAKASLMIPLLTLAPIPGISKNVIILCYLLGDGYTNILYPTCSTLMIGLGLANVSYIDWIKRTWWFQLALLVSSVLFLWAAVALGL